MTGLQAARELVPRKPGLRILMLSMHDNEQYFFESLKAGATGYVLKSVADQRSRAGLSGRHARRTVHLSRSNAATLVRDLPRAAPSRRPVTARRAHPREQEVVKLIAEGHSSKEIATLLTISLKTVERHRVEHPRKLGCETGPSSPATPSAPASSSRK